MYEAVRVSLIIFSLYLHRKQLVHLFDEMQEAVTEVLNRWEGLAQNQAEVEMGDKMAEITISVITRTMFGQETLSPDEITSIGRRLPMLLCSCNAGQSS